MQWREHGIWGQEARIVVGIHPETFVLKVFMTLFTLDLSCPISKLGIISLLSKNLCMRVKRF